MLKGMARIVRWFLLTSVVLLVGLFVYQTIAVRGTFSRSLPASEAPGTAVMVGAKGHQTAGRMFVVGAVDSASPLVVLLHGDAPFRNPGYQYVTAKNVAKAAPGTRVVALLRPGYADPFGARSDGDRGYASGDNYTPDDVDQVAQAVWQMKKQYGVKTVVLAGHSGGAAMTGNVAALYPGLVQQAVLVACPCDLASFREHMWHTQHSPLWLLPVKSLSPIETLEKMKPGATITAISGASDPIAPPQDVVRYVAKATGEGVAASILLLPGEGHEIFDEEPVIGAIVQAVKALETPTSEGVK